MSEESAIEWTDSTWNPVRGCTKISPGCKHCYAETFAERWRGVAGHPYEQGFELKLWPNRLDIPLPPAALPSGPGVGHRVFAEALLHERDQAGDTLDHQIVEVAPLVLHLLA